MTPDELQKIKDAVGKGTYKYERFFYNGHWYERRREPAKQKPYPVYPELIDGTWYHFRKAEDDE